MYMYIHRDKNITFNPKEVWFDSTNDYNSVHYCVHNLLNVAFHPHEL